MVNNTFPTSFFLGDENQIWKKDKNSTQLSHLFLAPILPIERIEIFNIGSKEKDEFIIVIFAHSTIKFTDEIGK